MPCFTLQHCEKLILDDIHLLLVVSIASICLHVFCAQPRPKLHVHIKYISMQGYRLLPHLLAPVSIHIPFPHRATLHFNACTQLGLECTGHATHESDAGLYSKVSGGEPSRHPLHWDYIVATVSFCRTAAQLSEH